ncbi:MAG: hypothetical protein ACI9JY_001942, partial [Saprospiraceae bacterium]
TCYVKDVEDMGLKLETSNISHRAGAKLFCMCSTLNTEHFRHRVAKEMLCVEIEGGKVD